LGAGTGAAITTAAKIWLVGLPLVWSLWIDRARPGLLPLRRDGLGWGVASGVVIAVAILAGYGLVGRHWIDAAAMREIAVGRGLGDPGVYLLGAVYWCAVNALIEELVWRWFVYRQCARLMPPARAVPATALLFTLHHIIALAAYFDWRITLIGSAGVFTGSVIWSILYLRYRSLWPAYISHIGADVAVFLIGAWLIFG
jgi:membrane protease YdiL (CAAX protease family)